MNTGKKTFKSLMFFCCAVFLHHLSFAQVNLQTGSATYSMPIFNWQDDKSRLLSTIALNYSSAGGLKVNDVASNEGQGWSMFAGGVITRMQVGEPDDQQAHGSDGNDADLTKYPNGLLYANVTGDTGCPTQLIKYPIYKGMNQLYSQKNATAVDRQADYFSFEFNGKTGMFIVARDGTARVIGDSRLQISFQTDVTMANNTSSGIRTTIKSFTVTDVDGLIYKFGLVSSANTFSAVSQFCGMTKVLQTQFCDQSFTNILGQPTFKDKKVYFQSSFDLGQYVNPWVIGSWYLAEVDDPFASRKITFTYNVHQLSANAGVQIYDNVGSKDYVVVDNKNSITSSLDLATISYPDGHAINFNYSSTQRADYPGEYPLASIDILYQTRYLAKYLFTTSYLMRNRYGTPSTPYQKSIARLYLKRVQKIGTDLKEDSPPYDFDYYLTSGTANADDFVPPPFFYAKDIYGFYNGSNSVGYNGETIPLNTSAAVFSFWQLKGLCFIKSGVGGVVVAPKSGYAQNGLLRQVVYPTGGSIVYQYAQNVNSAGSLDGGVHVSQTSTYDGGYSNGCSTPVTTQYNFVMNGVGSASSLWGTETPANSMTLQNHYAPEYKTFHLSWSCGACCYWHFQYPGIMNQYEAISIEGFQNFMRAIAPVLTIVGVITDIMDVATVVGGSTGFGAIAAVVIDVIGILLEFGLTCFGSSGVQNTTTTTFYNSNLNDISPLPKQFMRVEITQSPGGIGKTVQTFTSQNDYPVWVASNPLFTAAQRFAPWAYGLPDSTMVYDASGRLIKETKNIYSFGLAKHQFSTVVSQGVISHPDLTSCKCEVLHSYSQRSDKWSAAGAASYTKSSSGDLSVGFYNIYTGRVELDTTVERVYTVGTPSQFVETRTAYAYNSMADTSYARMTPANNYEVRQVANWKSNGDTLYKTFSYPGDYTYTTLNNGLIGDWPMNNSGNDISGNGYNGILTNVTATTDHLGNANGALLFNGTSSYVTIADNGNLRLYNTDYSISAWVRLDAYNTGLNSAILSRRGALGSGQGYLLSITGVNSINSGGVGPTTGGLIKYNNGATSYQFPSSSGLGQWHLVSEVYNLAAQTLTVYLDASQFTQFTVVAPPPNTSYPLTIGFDEAAVLSNSGGYYFQGAMSDLRLYNRGLSSSEIQQLYNNSAATPGILANLLQSNIGNIPVEDYSWESLANGQGVRYLGERVTEFTRVANNSIEDSVQLEQRFVQPQSSINLYHGPANTNNPAYKKVRVNTHGSNSKITGMQDEGGRVETHIYDYNDKYVAAAIIDADPILDSSCYTSFETTTLGGWKLTGTASYNNSGPAITGSISFNMLASGANSVKSPVLNTSKPYILSFWATNSNSSVSSGVTLSKSGPTINGFTYYEYAVAQGTSTVTLVNNAAAASILDELRLYPKMARMRTTTYDPLIGKTSECDENNRIRYYEYDNLTRLKFIEDENRNVVKMYEYNNISMTKRTGCPQIYFNHLISETIVKNNCGSGYQGTPVTVTIPANKDTSTASQADADAKAEIDLILSGQSTANSQGSCLLIYYNQALTTRDSVLYCSPGKKGIWVNYTVPYARYSSTVSQATVDSLAILDTLANGAKNANILADSASYCVYDTTADWESDSIPNFKCVADSEYVLQTNRNPNSPSFNTTRWVNEYIGDSACAICAFTWSSSITSTITGYTSNSGSTGSFTYRYFPPYVGYTGGSIGTITGDCTPSGSRSIIVTDGADSTRTWQVMINSGGQVSVTLWGGSAPTTTSVPIILIGSYPL